MFGKYCVKKKYLATLSRGQKKKQNKKKKNTSCLTFSEEIKQKQNLVNLSLIKYKIVSDKFGHSISIYKTYPVIWFGCRGAIQVLGKNSQVEPIYLSRSGFEFRDFSFS